MTAATTCDECGKTAECRAVGFAWRPPPGWLTITGLQPRIAADVAAEHREHPDLCSLACIAAWATRRAGPGPAQAAS